MKKPRIFLLTRRRVHEIWSHIHSYRVQNYAVPDRISIHTKITRVASNISIETGQRKFQVIKLGKQWKLEIVEVILP